jgi:hypothetical protein
MMSYIPVDGQYCYVCGLDQEEDIHFLTSTICSCCSEQYSLSEIDLGWIRSLRQEWIDAGYPWFRPEERPENWNPLEQMKQIPEKYW